MIWVDSIEISKTLSKFKDILSSNCLIMQRIKGQLNSEWIYEDIDFPK